MQFFSITVFTRSSVEAHRPSAARSAHVLPPVIPDMTTFEVSVHPPSTGSATPPGDDAKPRSAGAVRSERSMFADAEKLGIEKTVTSLNPPRIPSTT